MSIAISADQVTKFQEVVLERSYLYGLMTYTSLEAQEALINTKQRVFSSESRVELFKTIVGLFDKQIIPTLETVSAETRKRGLSIDSEFIEIMKNDPTPNFAYVRTRLEELAKDRRVFLKMLSELESMVEHNKTASSVIQDTGEYLDIELSDGVEDVKTYAELKQEVLAMPAHVKYPTGIRALDSLLGGGIALGQLIVFLGDPDAGKTVLLNQMLRVFADGQKPNCKAGAFPFEFTGENFCRNLMENNRDNDFIHNYMLVNDKAMDIHQLKASIITMIRRGAIFIGVDSQMMIEDLTHRGSLEVFETAKFKMLIGLAKRYNVIIAVIAQRSKDSKRGEIFGSKLAGHIAHIIFDMTLPNPDDKLHPTLKLHKNKQNGMTNKELPLKLDRYNLKYKYVDKGKEGKVGRKKNDDKQSYEIVYEDKENNNKGQGSFELPDLPI